MNIVVAQHGNHYLMNSIAATLSSVEDINIIAWVPSHKPIFDMIDETYPDIMICGNELLSPVTIQAAQEYNIQLIVFGKCQPSIPNLQIMCLFEDENIPNSYIYKPAGNIAQFHNLEYNNKYDSDLLYISETSNISPDHLLLLDKLGRKYKLKACGSQRIPLLEYIGIPTLVDLHRLMGSTKIVLDFNKHILYDCAVGRVFCLSNASQDVCPHYTDIDDMYKQINHFVKDDKHRQHFIKKAYQYVKSDNTHFHRLIDIFSQINQQEIAQQLSHILETKFK